MINTHKVSCYSFGQMRGNNPQPLRASVSLGQCLVLGGYAS